MFNLSTQKISWHHNTAVDEREESKKAENDSKFDYMNQRKIPLLLGGHLQIKRPVLLSVVNRIIWALSVIFMMSLFVLCVLTLIKKSDDKPVLIQTIFITGVLTADIPLTIIFAVNKGDLNVGAKYIREGLFDYNDGLDESYLGIKKKRVSQLKTLISVYSNLYYGSVLAYVVFGPILKRLFLSEDTPDPYVNQYLPLQIVIPFHQTKIGFLLAYIIISWALIYIYSIGISFSQIYFASILQMTAELEVLNFSIENIEKRAYFEFKQRNLNFAGEMKMSLYNDPEFQRCMIFSLRQNIRHHHAIIRFKRAVYRYASWSLAVIAFAGAPVYATAIIIVSEDPKKYAVVAFIILSSVSIVYPQCLVGELLSTASGLTASALYGCPWPDCSEMFKMDIRIFLQNTIRPWWIWAQFIKVRVSLEMFSDIVSAGYKLFNIFREF